MTQRQNIQMYIANIDRNEGRNSNMMMIYFNTSFSIMYQSSREKINKKTEDLQNTLYTSKNGPNRSEKIPPAAVAENTSFSSVHRAFQGGITS